MFTEHRRGRNIFTLNAENSIPTYDRKYDGSGALLNMLAEVASQTLHSDPSVKTSFVNDSTVSYKAVNNDQLFNKRKTILCRSRIGESDVMDLKHIRTLSANHLIRLFSEFDGDEMRRIFQYTCSMEPERCNKQFSSFGSEGKARQQMRSHLLEHVQQLELNSTCGVKMAVEPVKVRNRRVAHPIYNANNRKKLSQDCITKDESNENDSSIPNTKIHRCSVGNLSIFVNSFEEHPKFENISTHVESESLADSLVTSDEGGSKKLLKCDLAYCKTGLQKNSNISIEEMVQSSKIYEEHSYSQFGIAVENSSTVSVESEVHCKSMIKMDKSSEDQDLKPLTGEKITLQEAHIQDVSRFMVTETIKDTIMVCVVEDNQIQLTQLPCVGQEVDVGTSQSSPCPIINSGSSVLDNINAELQDCSTGTVLEMSYEKNIERDEHKHKKKPKGKAKFIGQSKAEKEMAVQLIDIMKRKGNSMEPLECHICCPSRTFTAPTTLISHYRSHAGIKPYECRICRSAFTRQHSLNYHMLIHSNQTRFTCGDCGRKFRHPSHFKEHRRRHTGESPYECSDCMLRFKTRNTYKRHLKTRHGKVLTTSGNLIILSEEEFRRVRTLPRSHQSTDLNVGEKQHGRKSICKGKVEMKVSSIRRQKDVKDVRGCEDIRGEVKDYYYDTNQNANSTDENGKTDVRVRAPEYVKEEKENPKKSHDRCHLIHIDKKDSQASAKSETVENQHFQDIVEKAMIQSDISFLNSECETLNTKSDIQELTPWKTTTVFRENYNPVKGKTINGNALDMTKMNIKSNWNTMNIHLKKLNKVKVCVHRSSAYDNKGRNKSVTQLLPKPVKSDLSELHNSVQFAINAPNMTTVLPNTSFPDTLTFLRPQYSLADKSVNYISPGMKADIIGIVAQDKVNIINTESHQTTIMLLANSCGVSTQNFI